MSKTFATAVMMAMMWLYTCDGVTFGQAERAATSLKKELVPLAPLIGSWTGATDGATPRRVEIVFREELAGHVIAGDYTSTHEGRPLHQMMLFTYDPLRREYRCAVIDNIYGLLDVYEGQRSGSQLVLSNERAGTSGKVAYRFLLDVSNKELVLKTEVRRPGKDWAVESNITLRRN